jgi:hypothetical protein
LRRFSSTEKLKAFFDKVRKTSRRLETNYYIQRNNIYDEKIIERTKNLVTQMLAGN